MKTFLNYLNLAPIYLLGVLFVWAMYNITYSIISNPFFQQNWYYIIPSTLIIIMMGTRWENS